MSWKPSRSSGIMFDKYTRKANENRKEVIRMIESQEYISFERLNKFSKHVYLHWLNENKAHCALVGRRFNPESPRYGLDVACVYEVILKMFEEHKQLLYKPLQKYFNHA